MCTNADNDVTGATSERAARRPNFFIIGAPKAGTTSLHAYLAEHPRIFMSRNKEPFYFCPDIKRGARIRDIDMYLGLFAKATNQHLALGESSTGYLRSKVAVPEIMAFNPQARLIAMLRNPIELAHSFHAQLIRNLWETVTDFEAAWRYQETRALGNSIPDTCPEPEDLLYRQVVMLGSQVEILLNRVPRDRVKFIVFEDLVEKPRAVYEDVLRFLGVPSDHRANFDVVNPHQVHRSRFLASLIQSPPFPLNLARNFVRARYRRHSATATWFVRTVYRLNSRQASRAPLAPELRREIEAELHDDVRLLETLIERDLSRWIPHRTRGTQKYRKAS